MSHLFRAFPDPSQQQLCSLVIIVDQELAAVIDSERRLENDQTLLRLLKIDATPRNLSHDGLVISLRIPPIKRELEVATTRRRAVTCAGIASHLGQHRHHIVHKVNPIRGRRLHHPARQGNN